jgi:hypothetical protein
MSAVALRLRYGSMRDDDCDCSYGDDKRRRRGRTTTTSSSSSPCLIDALVDSVRARLPFARFEGTKRGLIF